MWQLTYRGKGIGTKYSTEKQAIQTYIRLFPSFLGLGWKQCEDGDSLTA